MVASALYFTQVAQLDRVRKALADAAARGASSLTTHVTNGTGTDVPSTPFDFGVSFHHEPAVLSGFVIARGPGTGWQLPRVSTGVYRWVRNAQGLFTGAYLYFAVDCPVDIDLASNGISYPPPNPSIVHHLVFQATASHDLSGSTDLYLESGLAMNALLGGTA